MKTLVLGAGKTGLAAARLARKLRHQVLLSDQKKIEVSSDIGFDIHFGNQNKQLLKDVSMIIKSPGIPPQAKILQYADEKKIPVLSEVEFALKQFEGKVYGVTGTNGKSTVTSMIEQTLNRNGHIAKACGNIGFTVSDAVMMSPTPEILIIELSSYQLHSTQNINLDGALWLNFTEDHLAFHKTMEEYFNAKAKISEFSKTPIWIDNTCSSFAESIGHSWSKTPVEVSDSSTADKYLPQMPKHNRMNAEFVALLLSELVGVSIKDSFEALQNFQGLEHRFQSFTLSNEKCFINDSKATNLQSLETALDSLESTCLLLMGGQGKGEDFKPLERFKNKIDRAIFFGASANELQQQLPSLPGGTCYNGLNDLMQNEVKELESHPCVLLSPGCASFDEFANFEERGDFFVREMKKILGIEP